MSELAGMYALWYREIKVFLREQSRIISSVVNPLVWLIFFGAGFGSLFGGNYQAFIFPGVVMLTVLFSSIFFGIYLVWDKKVDFFKEVLAAPLRRTTLFVGKTIGGATDSLIQAALLIILGVFFGVKYTPYSVLILVLYVIFISVGTTSLGLAIGAQMTSFEGFGLINSFFVFPLFFLSGALYPITSLPSYLKILTSINPFTYMVDGMRGAIYPPSTTFHMSFSPILDLGIGLGFMLILIAVGVFSFQHMRS